MDSCTPTSSRQYGFTLIELIVAICITTIVAAFIVIFIRTPVENYIAQSRRSELITEADLIERSLSQDIRSALPNSTRADASGQILEMISIFDMAVYRAENTSTIPSPGNLDAELKLAAPDSKFQMLGIFSKINIPPACCGTRYQMVIGHDQSIPAQDLYRGGNVITPAAMTITLTRQITPPTTRIDSVQLGANFTFLAPSPNQHAFLVTNPVSAIAFVCDLNNRTLKRYDQYPIAAGVAANRNAAARISTISNDVALCNFLRSPSTKWTGDVVTANIQLTRAGETQNVFIQQAVENRP